MKIRNGWVGNSSSSSFIIIGGSIDYDGELYSYDKFTKQYLQECIFGNWFIYNLSCNKNKPTAYFCDDDKFSEYFIDKFDGVILLPVSCKNKYEKLISSHKFDEITEYCNEITEYCGELLKSKFENQDIYVYDGDDHIYINEYTNEEEYVEMLFDECTDYLYKRSFNNH